MEELNIRLYQSSNMGFGERHTVKPENLAAFLLDMKERFNCGKTVVHFDPMYEGEDDQVTIWIYDDYME